MQDAIFSVSRLNAEVRQLLEQGFGRIWLVGEISNFAAPSSGHWYFTLKDERAQIKCAMFRNSNQRVRLRPGNGMQVLVRAKLTVYEPRGDYQLIAEHLEDAGQGLLQQQFEQLKLKLAGEGLFNQQHKQPLPERVRRLGVITSPTGAAIRDVLAVLKRRDPGLAVIIYPTAVQGADAAQQIRQALATAIRRNECDALLLTRGGGSLEDLWCFNDEALARDIFDCPLPLISAVGHEVDFTIADFVADVRSPTPSAAAELVSYDQTVELRQLQQQRQRLQRAMQQYLWRQQQRQQQCTQRLRLRDPQRQLQQQGQRCDELMVRAAQALSRRQQQAQQQLSYTQQRLQRLHPQRDLLQQQQRLQELQQRLSQRIERRVSDAQQRFARQAQALHLVSPLNVLSRGYAIVRDDQQQVIRSAQQVRNEQTLTVTLSDGELKVINRLS
ncbi:exodeoxyribonuclease VII large subunit [Idiomarina xiamenensis]|uniref:Exodeoxyribonuclease 7 large subunit n=1 Tax=Idiomarina xiamenensis 10-D-4 TaxID=740709 RepID=K2KBP6_9GAMM|nr:exodeoxyribonuclease VII large subunit [Idiomarina xiamenensis]EKE85208.1 exodeoxyribonuclease VII large subunit [Idiomarina xiamenensis 10-D-4]